MSDEIIVKTRRLTDGPIQASEVAEIIEPVKPKPPRRESAYDGSRYNPPPQTRVVQQEKVDDLKTWARNDAKKAYAFILAVMLDRPEVFDADLYVKRDNGEMEYKGAGIDMKLRLKAAQEILDRAFGKSVVHLDDSSNLLGGVTVNILRMETELERRRLEQQVREEYEAREKAKQGVSNG